MKLQTKQKNLPSQRVARISLTTLSLKNVNLVRSISKKVDKTQASLQNQSLKQSSQIGFINLGMNWLRLASREDNTQNLSMQS